MSFRVAFIQAKLNEHFARTVNNEVLCSDECCIEKQLQMLQYPSIQDFLNQQQQKYGNIDADVANHTWFPNCEELCFQDEDDGRSRAMKTPPLCRCEKHTNVYKSGQPLISQHDGHLACFGKMPCPPSGTLSWDCQKVWVENLESHLI